MKHSLLLLVLVWGVLCIPPALAHSEDSNDDVSGTLHPEPDHDPVVGKPSTLNFFMEQGSGTFDPEAYTYSLHISGDAGTSTVSAAADGPTVRAIYSFPEIGEYRIELLGSSTDGEIPSFALSYRLFVSAEEYTGHHDIGGFLGHHGGHVLIVVILIFGLMGVFLWEKLSVARQR